MARKSATPPESFEEILAWLNPDRDLAGHLYVQLRADLTKIFMWNRCADPEGLTDEVFDRVAKKVHELREAFIGDPRLFFYGVARNLIKEESKKMKVHVSLDGIDIPAQPASEIEEPRILREECLQECLRKLKDENRELIIDYYARDKQAKINHRAEMAQRLGTSVEALRVRVHRIRATLEQCTERCLHTKKERETD